jgi:hypothetical protein
MKLRDGIGNELSKGDFVMVQREDKVWLIGSIMEIKESSILAAATGSMMMPGMVQIALMPINLMFDPKNSTLGNVIKVSRPSSGADINKT